MNSCKNCNDTVTGNFCSNCGYPVELKKINREYVLREIKATLFSDRGFVYTTKRLLFSPGECVKHYITENRSRHVRPITYLIITCLIYTLASQFLKIDYLAQFEMPDTPVMNQMGRWVMENLGYSSIIVELYMAFWIKLFFRKSGYNIYEIFILLCYVSGIQFLFHTIALIPEVLIHSGFITISAIISTIYSFWAIGQFFDRKKAKSYLKVIFSFIVGYLIISVAGTMGAFIELIIRKP
jgi:hypothetical protein